jgi:OmpA-OmpF porin, OOP family
MQAKKLVAAMCGLSAALFATQASAIMSIPIGWYLEVNAGSTHLSNSPFSNGHVSSSGLGGNINVGYKFMPFFALELGYTHYAQTTVKNDNDQKAADVKFYSYDLAGKGILPIVDSGAEVFAKLGAVRLSQGISIQNETAARTVGIGSSNHSSTNVYIALGLQYYFMPELAANIQWGRAKGTSSTGTLDLISIGASFIFE